MYNLPIGEVSGEHLSGCRERGSAGNYRLIKYRLVVTRIGSRAASDLRDFGTVFVLKSDSAPPTTKY